MRFSLYHDMGTEIHKLDKNHKDGKNHIIWLLRFCGRFVGAILADLCAVRYAHMTRICLGLMPLRVSFCGFSRF